VKKAKTPVAVKGATIKPAEKPVAKPAPEKPVPIKRRPEPEIVPPIAIVEETILEEPIELPDLASIADEEPVDSHAPRYIEAKQEEMQFEPTRGRFEKTHETIYRGENLDQPTFRRRRLTIQL
jgi:hypothetical protein